MKINIINTLTKIIILTFIFKVINNKENKDEKISIA